MSWLGDFIGSGAGSFIEKIGDTAKKFITTDKDRNDFLLEIERELSRRDKQIELSIRKEIESKERVLVAELGQGDRFTKRARPSIIYFGLFAILFNYMLVPTISIISASSAIYLQLPTEFWAAWGGISGTWVIGRSMEKRGTRNKFTDVVAGKQKSILD